SSALLDLNQGLFTGKHIESAEIEVYASVDGKPVLLDEFRFKDIALTSLETANGAGNVLSFDYGVISHTHLDQTKSGGSSGVASSSSWDFFGNKSGESYEAKADVTPGNVLQSM